MSRTLHKTKYHNYLTLPNGCKTITNGAKPLHHNNPDNILTDNIRELWLTKELPAVCIIDLRNMHEKPTYFNRIGFICWHEYDSNPKLIEVEYTGQDNPQNSVWVVLSKIRLELTSTWQHFKLPLTQTKNISFLKLKIMQNHAQPNNQNQNQQTSQTGTYLNQVSLGFVQQIIESRVELTTASNVNMRDKTFSDYRKVGTSDKEVKRLADKVKHLSNDNQTMRKTIDYQNSIIIKLQEAVQTLAQKVGGLQTIQKAQDKRIKHLEKIKHQKNGHDLKQPKKQRLQQFFNDESQIVGSAEEKGYSREKGNHTSGYDDRSGQLSRTDKSVYKSGKGKSKERSNQKSSQSKKRTVINANINQSEQSLSEYEGVVDQRAYKYGRDSSSKGKEVAYIPMLQKLQELILLRDEKKHRLKTHKKHKRSANIVLDSEDSDSDEQSDD